MDAIRSPLRGATLLEVLVAGFLLSLMTFALMAIYKVGLGNATKVEVNSDTYRQMVVALERIRLELRGAHLLYPLDRGDSDTRVEYLYPQLTADGKLVVDQSGNTVWGGGAQISLDAEGRVVRTGVGPEQLLARLGPQGELRFTVLEPRLLDVYVKAQQGERQNTLRFSERVMTLQLFLSN